MEKVSVFTQEPNDPPGEEVRVLLYILSVSSVM